MKIKPLIRKMITEILDETVGLSLKFISQIGNVITISINGKRYSYRVSGNAKEFARKLQKMMGFSHGRALAWLKRNSTEVK